MSDFIAAHLVGDDWRELCGSVAAALGGAGPGDLGFVYLAEQFAADADAVVARLREDTGIGHWVGCVGMGLCSSGLETYEQGAIAVLATPFAADDFRLIPPLQDRPDAWLDQTRAWREANLASVAVVHAEPTDAALPERLRALSDGLENGFLVGGIASAETAPVTIADGACPKGLSGVLLSGRVAVHTGLTQGCSLIGQKRTITGCQRNVIETLDDRPALDVLKEDIGEILARDLSRIGGYIFAALPIAGSDTGDYLVRNLIGIDPERGLVAIGDLVEPGMALQFARRDAETAREDLGRMIDQLIARLPGEPRGALYHSCLGRGRYLFGDDSAELKLIRERLGDPPMAGFYANGEISHRRLYGYTGVLTLFC